MNRTSIVLFLMLLLLSCHKANLEYSCNPLINELVVKNRPELSGVSINELATYDIQLQRAVFNSWNYQKKRDAWIEKLNYVLIHIPFKEPEMTHIHKLITHISEDYFLKENIEKNREIRARFAAEWISYSMNELGWPDQFIAFMVYRLYTDQAQFTAELSMLSSISRSPVADSEPGDCNCNVPADFCYDSICTSTGCTITTGCGWLWTMPCNGQCY
jgi:hypothetical protein